MALTVDLYSFSKRDNSTKQPIASPTAYSCILKEECGVINPVIIIQEIGNPSGYNYAYIPSFGRYYWIREWTWVLGRWEAELYTDVLATFKDYIGNSEQYIVRSSHTYDGEITDNLYPTVAVDETQTVDIGNSPLSASLYTGDYVLGVINKNGGYGAIEYYVLNRSEFLSLCSAMFANNPAWYDITSIVKSTPSDITEIALPTEVMKSLVNPMQYVVSCVLFPDSITVPILGSSNIYFGWWNSNISAHLLAPLGFSDLTLTFSIPSHPQSSSRGNYLNLSPYTRTILNAGPFGCFPLDMTYFTDTLTGSLRIGVDCITGEATLLVRNNQGHIIEVHRGQVGIPIKLAQISKDYLQMAQNSINTIANATSGIIDTIESAIVGDITGAIDAGVNTVAQTTNGIVSTVKSAMPTLVTAGSGGSLYELARAWTLTVQHFILAEEDNANRGRPLAQKKIIKNIPGYIMVDDPDVETTGLGQETALIKQYMRGGFFYE